MCTNIFIIITTVAIVAGRRDEGSQKDADACLQEITKCLYDKQDGSRQIGPINLSLDCIQKNGDCSFILSSTGPINVVRKIEKRSLLKEDGKLT
ncbi:hypothetical protein EG68_06897 [Paragonimus skrjabini miyazakii]|uniref:Uncharacterized protein n=1 Tax=Paragonimus skrjabini miyazakii TaxID=59628 RepID=A0A8S9YRY8_9TREM|nr:hypothetical protein EG68_06897 [Paragonimus skrjabini miyazakii]